MTMASQKSQAEKKPGIIRRVGSVYVWSIVGDWSEVRDNARRVRERFDQLRSRRYRKENFADAVARLGLTNECLCARHDQLSSLSVIYGLIVLVAFGSLCAAPWSEHPINHALMSIGVALVAGSKFLASRFRAAQIRAGKLFGFKDWLLGKAGGW
jgi:hypothetical protein